MFAILRNASKLSLVIRSSPAKSAFTTFEVRALNRPGFIDRLGVEGIVLVAGDKGMNILRDD